MPQTSSSKKRMRQGETRRQRNRVQRTELRSLVKKVRAAGSGEEAAAAFRKAEQVIDRAARKHLIHANKAARDKSRLQKLIKSKS